jgi:nicotinate-nucleotide pyrophosphorylase (carboxylating)
MSIRKAKDPPCRAGPWEEFFARHEAELRDLVRLALEEDTGARRGERRQEILRRDLTSYYFVPASAGAVAGIVARQECILCGAGLARLAFEELAEGIRTELHLTDGERVTAGQKVLTVKGPLRAIATAERVALNFLGRLSGIATMAWRFREKAGAGKARLLDTRKTTPGLRLLEKYAARCGGIFNHRRNLREGILIKDTHLVCYRGKEREKLAERVARVRKAEPGVPIWIEAQSLEEAEFFASLGVDGILLDNFSPKEVEEAMVRLGRRVLLEASGGIGLGEVARFVQTGVARISLGAVTRGATWTDFALEVESIGKIPRQGRSKDL